MTARETLIANVAHTSGRSIDLIAGWKQGIFGIAFLAGPALAGMLLATMPAIDVVWITAACSAIAALTTWAMPLNPLAEEPTDENPLGALATVRQSRPLVWLLVIGVASSLVVSPMLSVILPAHFQRLGHADWLGLSMSAFAVGMVAGGGLYAGLMKRWRFTSWVTGMLLFTVAFVLIASLQGPPSASAPWRCCSPPNPSRWAPGRSRPAGPRWRCCPASPRACGGGCRHPHRPTNRRPRRPVSARRRRPTPATAESAAGPVRVSRGRDRAG